MQNNRCSGIVYIQFEFQSYIYIYHHHILYIYLFTAKIQVFPIEIGALPRRIVHSPSFGMVFGGSSEVDPGPVGG